MAVPNQNWMQPQTVHEREKKETLCLGPKVQALPASNSALPWCSCQQTFAKTSTAGGMVARLGSAAFGVTSLQCNHTQVYSRSRKQRGQGQQQEGIQLLTSQNASAMRTIMHKLGTGPHLYVTSSTGPPIGMMVLLKARFMRCWCSTVKGMN